jgi:outer membrane protein assembly factor BamB
MDCNMGMLSSSTIGRRLLYRCELICIAGIVVMLVMAALPVPAVYAKTSASDWATFMESTARTGYNKAESIINPKSAPNLKLHWQDMATSAISAQPIEANGMVYWGSWDGLEHASRLSDGKDIWTANLGQTQGDCIHIPQGVLSTATVATEKIGGKSTPVVFVGGGDVQLYALNANTGAVIWKTQLGTQPSYFLYSATAVFDGSVYIGVSSLGDCPLIQGQVVRVNAQTGAIQNTFNTVPSGCIGGSVWGSPSIDTKTKIIYFATGNPGTCGQPEPLTDAVVALNAKNLSLVGSWQIPPSQQVNDGDFGSTPTLFSATINGTLHQMAGLINKNGIYYAFDRTSISAGPLWEDQLAAPISQNGTGNNISSSAWDGSTLYAAAAKTTISGMSCTGGIRAINPANGSYLWQVCLSNDVLDPVSAVPGLVILGSGPNILIFNAKTGQQLFSFTDTNKNSKFWGPASISRGVLYQGNADGILYAFGT